MGLFGNEHLPIVRARPLIPFDDTAQDGGALFDADGASQRLIPIPDWFTARQSENFAAPPPGGRFSTPASHSGEAASLASRPTPKAKFAFSERCEEAMNYAKTLAWFNGTKFDKPIERAALKAWLSGRTAPLQLGPNFLRRINDYVHRSPGNIDKDNPLPSKRYDPPGSYRMKVRFGAHGADPNFDALLGSATVIFDRQGSAIGLEDSFDFNGGPKYGPITNWAMGQVRSARASKCGTSGDFRITAGSGK